MKVGKKQPEATQSRQSGWVCLRAFRFSGKDFQVGDAFPWEELGCSERRLGQLVSGRRVGPAKEPASV